jgi:hypothetical protein
LALRYTKGAAGRGSFLGSPPRCRLDQCAHFPSGVTDGCDNVGVSSGFYVADVDTWSSTVCWAVVPSCERRSARLALAQAFFAGWLRRSGW